MSLKSEIHCPTSQNAKTVTVDDAFEQLVKRELRKIKSEQNKIVITTGGDVSTVVWAQEKLDELQCLVDKIKKEEQEYIRASFDLSGIKCTDSQYTQIVDSSKHL